MKLPSIDKIKDKVKSKIEGFVSGKLNPSEMDKPDHLEKYSITNLNYPIDLFSAEKPIGPYVMFYINVSAEAKIAKPGGGGVFIDDFDHSTRKAGATRRMGQAGTATQNVIMGTSAAVSMGVLSGVGVSSGVSVPILMAGSAAMRSQGLNFSRPQKRLKNAIALHMPNNLAANYKANYNTDDQQAFLAATRFGKSVADFASGSFNAVKDAATREDVGAIDAMKKIVNTGISAGRDSSAALTGTALNLMPGGAVVSNLTGISANPMMQTVFTGVDPRSFTMDYSFFPKSEEELESIQNIIKTFKENMLPEYKGADEFLFIYPAEFDIVYYMGAEENRYIHRHTSCVLRSMNINYTPDGIYNFFNSTGAPTRINVTLDFLELDIVTKDDVGAGY